MKFLVITMFLLRIPVVFSCDGFIPENNLWISPHAERQSGITEAQFNTIIDKLELMYKDEVTKLGGKLKIIRNWQDGTVNAFARQSGKTYEVQMFGGLARHEKMSEDAFALVLCHELGHHLGGAPKKAGWSGKWASIEGQADYYASLKCLKRYFEDMDNVSFMANVQLDQLAKTQCAKSFAEAGEQLVCERNAYTSLIAARFLDAIGSATNKINFDTPDTKVVLKTSEKHPPAQCRMDTYFAGTVCTAAVDSPLDNKDPNIGTCNEKSGHDFGHRPLCWYKPSKN